MSTDRQPPVSVCICTYRRTALLRRLLEDLCRQDTRGQFTFSVVVADNDAAQSGRSVVDGFVGRLPVTYVVEPRRNIALARNAAVAQARGEFVAFIDDDESPRPHWLADLLLACGRYEASGVLGPVSPRFEVEPPAWVRRGGFYQRPTHPTGFVMGWQECRTGNVLLRRGVVDGMDPVFREEFGTGGEDQDFFRRATAAGHRFVWCQEAEVFELVPPARWRKSVLMRRALLRGRNSLRHPQGRLRNTVKSLTAVPLYVVALPFLWFAGEHLFMRYAIRLGDHLGRLLALLGMNPVRERCDGAALRPAGAASSPAPRAGVGPVPPRSN